MSEILGNNEQEANVIAKAIIADYKYQNDCQQLQSTFLNRICQTECVWVYVERKNVFAPYNKCTTQHIRL